MTIAEWTTQTTTALSNRGVDTARLDTEVLLADAMQKDRSWLHAHADSVIPDDMLGTLRQQITRRGDHEPLAYIRGVQEFYGREFLVSSDTLTPRPETESTVQLALDSGLLTDDRIIVDIGTGSGCIIITLALEAGHSPDTKAHKYIGLDISAPALSIARKNAQKLNAPVEFKEFDMIHDDLRTISDPKSTIYLANLPYVPAGHTINSAAKNEPSMAIFGGKDGLDYYRHLFDELESEHCTVITESLQHQHQALDLIALAHGFNRIDTSGLCTLYSNRS